MLQQQNVLDIELKSEQPHHDDVIEALHEQAFGPGRFTRTAYRLREGRPAVTGLSFVACRQGRLIGSIRYGHVQLAGKPGILLGPLVVHPELASRGIGLALMRRSLDEAKAQGHGWVILVGDEPYYARVGFVRVPFGLITLPGPVDPARLLTLELQPGALAGLSGMLLPAG